MTAMSVPIGGVAAPHEAGAVPGGLRPPQVWRLGCYLPNSPGWRALNEPAPAGAF